MKENNHKDYFILGDEMVDISSAGGYIDDDAQERRYSKKAKSKKKSILIVSVTAAVVAVLGIGGFCVAKFLPNTGQSPSDIINTEFVYGENTYVSGISIAGKTFDEAKSLLELNKSNFEKKISITVDLNGEVLNLTQDDFDYEYDIDSVLYQIQSDELNSQNKNEETTEAKTYEVTAICSEASIDNKVAEIKKAVDKESENAFVSKFTPFAENRFEYKKESDGKSLNEEKLNEDLSKALNGSSSNSNITAEILTVKPSITVEDIKKNVVLLSTYKTVSTNTANGTWNMKISLEACNGSVIEPGETWSFNTCTGNSNLESNGYKSAGVIINGKISDGIGGGICQSSSTIYNAALRANMTIAERSNHKWPSSYVPTGLDATIDYPRLDLKLTNPTDYQMFMECKLDGKTLYASIWGVKVGDYDVIKAHNEIASKGDSSYKVKAWRIYVKDGKEIDREQLGSSTYDAKNGYTFKSADNDKNAVTDNVNLTIKNSEEATKATESVTKATEAATKATEKPTQPTTQKPTQKPTQPTTQKPTQKPTEKPTTPAEPTTEPHQPTTEPPQSDSNTAEE